MKVEMISNYARVGAVTNHSRRARCPWSHSERSHYRDTSLIRNSPPPSGHHRALGIVLLQGPRGAQFRLLQ